MCPLSSHKKEATCPKWNLVFKLLHFLFYHLEFSFSMFESWPIIASCERASLTTLTNATLLLPPPLSSTFFWFIVLSKLHYGAVFT